MTSRASLWAFLGTLAVASVTSAQVGDAEVTPEATSPSETARDVTAPTEDPATDETPSETTETTVETVEGETTPEAPITGEESVEATETLEAPEDAEEEPAETATEEPIFTLEWGRGLTVRSDDDAFSLTIRGRIQARAEVVVSPEPLEANVEFMIRRARLLLAGHLFSHDFQYYFQLGFAPLDMEADRLIPLRDAALTWSGIPNFSIRVGQMKVPFNRERVISSSALQLPDRSPVNAELTLDRDIGIQIFGDDLFDLGGYLGYQIGVFQGDGRLRVNEGGGLLYVARLQIQPFGEFEDSYSEVDFTREDRPRLSIGIGGAFNHEARRSRSTHGSYYDLGGFDFVHAELDFIFKVAGFSAMGELLYRQTTGPSVRSELVDGIVLTDVASNALGYFLQAGYLFEPMIEIAARYAEIVPITSAELPQTSVPGRREITLGAGWYPIEHALKLQLDWSHISDPADDFDDGIHRIRLQLQAYF